MNKEEIQVLKDVIKVMERATYKDLSLVDMLQTSATLRAFADIIRRAETPTIEQPKTELKSGRTKR